jgi:hypothetical protein
MLSLNSIISGGLEALPQTFNLKLENFSGKLFAAEIQTKGFIAHRILLFYLKKGKNCKYWKMLFVQTSGLVIACD